MAILNTHGRCGVFLNMYHAVAPLIWNKVGKWNTSLSWFAKDACANTWQKERNVLQKRNSLGDSHIGLEISVGLPSDMWVYWVMNIVIWTHMLCSIEQWCWWATSDGLFLMGWWGKVRYHHTRGGQKVTQDWPVTTEAIKSRSLPLLQWCYNNFLIFSFKDMILTQ